MNILRIHILYTFCNFGYSWLSERANIRFIAIGFVLFSTNIAIRICHNFKIFRFFKHLIGIYCCIEILSETISN